MDEALINTIDKILNECHKDGFIIWSRDTPSIERKAIEIAQTMGLLTPNGKHSFDLTNQGLEVIHEGGFELFQKKTEEEKRTDREIKELTIKELKKNIFQLDYWWLFLILNAVLSGIISYSIIVLTK